LMTTVAIRAGGTGSEPLSDNGSRTTIGINQRSFMACYLLGGLAAAYLRIR
jgi:hypothetical protein